jgi:hypothetical protein
VSIIDHCAHSILAFLLLHRMSRLLCRFSDAGMTRLSTRCGAGVRKAPMHEVAGSWALAGSECYGDLVLAPISMMGGTPARRHLDVWTPEVGRVQ